MISELLNEESAEPIEHEPVLCEVAQQKPKARTIKMSSMGSPWFFFLRGRRIPKIINDMTSCNRLVLIGARCIKECESFLIILTYVRHLSYWMCASLMRP